MTHTRRTVLKSLGTIGALAAGAGTTTARRGPPGWIQNDPDGRGGGGAAVRVAHASPDAPNVDVFVDGVLTLEDVPFGAISDYLGLSPGTYRVRIEDAGNTVTVFDDDVTLSNEDYTVVALGEVFSDDTDFRPAVFEDRNARLSKDRARVRLVHASPDAPAVDVTVGGGALTVFDDLAFGHAQYATVPAGSYALEVRGATPNDDGAVVTTFDVDLEGGTTYTAIALGYLTPGDEASNETFDLAVAVDATAPPRAAK